ncbi:MAG: zinc-ribbon domain-containing protein, partial [Polyangiaceae bacterium]|nr:zinc-ribbon domain-containing protein [Polyangiaceae bacterium]
MKFLCEQCKAKYQISDDKVAGKTVRMKCRKCGHLIEVRAAVTESSVANAPPAATFPGGGAGAPGRFPQKASPALSSPLAASLAAARRPGVAARSDKPGTPTAAFKPTAQREEDGSAPFDMSELSAGDDWYVAVNGVPVGPIRIGEVRRKAALGAVTEDSLVWQEGLDEWRPLRTFPVLAAMVRDAVTGGRGVTPPPGEARASVLPQPRIPMRPPAAAMRAPSQRPTPVVAQAVPVAARNNVVPITSRLATAEQLLDRTIDETAGKLDDDLTDAGLPKSAPIITPAVPVPAPSSSAPAADAADANGAADVTIAVATPPPAAAAAPTADRRGTTSWLAIGMVAMFVAFGAVGGVVVFWQRNLVPAPVASVAPPPSEVASAATAAAVANDDVSPDPAATSDIVPVTSPAAPAAPPKVSPAVRWVAPAAAANAAAAAAAASASSGRALDLRGLSGNTVAPTDEMGGDGPKAAGQCFSEGQIAQVIGQHQVSLRRTCWERNAAAKTSANISVSLTIGADGSVQNVSSSGDDPSVA